MDRHVMRVCTTILCPAELPGHWFADASDLELPPGQFPIAVVLVPSSGVVLRRTSLDHVVARYASPDGETKLAIFND
jgi:hypothetical protein